VDDFEVATEVEVNREDEGKGATVDENKEELELLDEADASLT